MSSARICFNRKNYSINPGKSSTTSVAVVSYKSHMHKLFQRSTFNLKRATQKGRLPENSYRQQSSCISNFSSGLNSQFFNYTHSSSDKQLFPIRNSNSKTRRQINCCYGLQQQQCSRKFNDISKNYTKTKYFSLFRSSRKFSSREDIIAYSLRSKGFGNFGKDGIPNDQNNLQNQSNQNSKNSPDSSKQEVVNALTESLKKISDKNVDERGVNLVFGSSDNLEKWKQIDEKVNEYPGQRFFTAIGTGGDVFVQDMVGIVQGVLGSVHQECINTKESAKGKYVSVKVGPVWVENSEQVVAVYAGMKEDPRLKWLI